MNTPDIVFRKLGQLYDFYAVIAKYCLPGEDIRQPKATTGEQKAARGKLKDVSGLAHQGLTNV
ncbi:MAG: hypothetical protein V2A34_14325 [Lentisphaerota bacterium]